MAKMVLRLAIILAALCSCSQKNEGTDTPTKPVSDKILLKSCIMSSMHDIDVFESEGSITSYDLYCAVGETEHLQVKIYAKDYNTLELKWANLHPEIELVCKRFSDFGGFHNEVLVPCIQATPDSNQVVNLWLSFKATDKAKPNSKYTENISFVSSTSRANLKITIHTGSAVLPTTPSYPAIFGIYTKNAAIPGQYSDFLLNYGISPYFFDGWGSDGHSINCTPVPCEYGTSAFWEYVQNPRFAAIALPYYNLTQAQLKESIAKAKELGIWGKCYYYLYDEPCETSHFEKIKKNADILHAIDPDAKVLTSFYREPQDGPNKGKGIMATFDYLDLGRSDIYCVVEDEPGTAHTTYKNRLRENQQWWSYVAGWDHPGISHHSSKWENRAVMWRPYLEGASGFLYWAVNWFEKEDPLQERVGTKNLDGQLVYPGKAFGVDGMCASIRLERFRDSLEDLQLLQIYEKEHSRAEAETLVRSLYSGPEKILKSEGAIEDFHKTISGN